MDKLTTAFMRAYQDGYKDGHRAAIETMRLVPSDLDVEVNWTPDRENAIKYGFPNANNSKIAEFLLNLAERDIITMSHGVIATLVEAAARLDGDKFMEWERNRRPCVEFT